MEVLNAVTPDDRVARKKFERAMLENLDKDKGFARKITFSDISVFKVLENVNSLVTVHYITDSPEVNELPSLTLHHLIRRFSVSNQL